jgi:hypothetical protein
MPPIGKIPEKGRGCGQWVGFLLVWMLSVSCVFLSWLENITHFLPSLRKIHQMLRGENPKKLPLDKLEQLFYINAIAVISVNCDFPIRRKITGGSK